MKPDINLAQAAHALAKTLSYMGKPTMSRESDRIGNHITAQAARIAELEAALKEQTKDAEFMAHVWNLLRTRSDALEVGDPDGVQFVADRILDKGGKS